MLSILQRETYDHICDKINVRSRIEIIKISVICGRIYPISSPISMTKNSRLIHWIFVNSMTANSKQYMFESMPRLVT